VRKTILKTAAATAALLSFSMNSNAQSEPAAPATPAGPPPVLAQATQGSPDARADQLVAEMTQDEKIAILSGGPGGYSTKALPRLGIPSFVTADGPNGVRNAPGNPPSCAFPPGSALAATWDPELATAYGQAVGLEARARGVYFQLGPGLNICRVPVNGRNFEYFGEDPYLAGIVAANWVKGCAATGTVPTIKHFAANNQELDRNSVDAQVDERVMQEIYLPAFKKAVQTGANISLMCSYNRLNGSYASNNEWLLTQTLKNDWGFAGLVMSDWGASHATSDLAKGLDLEMPSPQNFAPAKVKAALADGSLKQSQLDSAVHRILRTAAAAGWLDAGWNQKRTDLPQDSADSAKVALQVAQNAIVLLKNDHKTLPLDRTKIKTIIVLGPNAAAAQGQAPINMGGGGSGAVATFPARYAEAEYLHGITQAAGAGVNVQYLPMPGNLSADVYNTLANAKAVTGEAGLTLNVQVTGAGDPVTIAPSVQPGINLTWQPGQLPLGVPAGRDATFTWTGSLVAPADSDWQLHLTGSPSVWLDDKELDLATADGTIIHLTQGKPVNIKIEATAQANSGRGGRGARGGGNRGGRGGRGGLGGNAIRVALTPPSIPDLSAIGSADAVIVCVGLNRNVEAEGRDRPFELTPVQQYLINAAGAANPHTIVINNSGGGVGMSAWADHAAAIVQAWYLGQEGGIALGQMLFGDINPSGKLVSTFDKHFEDNPAFAYYPGTTPAGGAYRIEPYTEGLFYGYRGYDKAAKEPLYPFGFGLSYTTFAYSNLTLQKEGDRVKVSLEVQNTGTVAGAEVVQIYVGEQNCPLPRPLRELKGFEKVSLKPGETISLTLIMPRDLFAYWSPEKKGWTVDTGNTFTIEAAASERDIRLKGTWVAQ